VPTTDDSFAPVPDARPQDPPWPALTWPPAPEVRLAGRIVDVTPADPARDADALFAALDDDRVWQHVKGRPDTAQAYAAKLSAGLAAGTLPWVVRLLVPCAGLPAGTVVGTSAYLDVSVPDARLEIGSTAYALAVWGSAVNPDTKLALLTHAFEVLGAGRVQLKTDVRNVRSQRAIARLGARHEGTLRRYQRRSDGSVRDTVLFAILAEEWPAVRAGLQRRTGAGVGRGPGRRR
jgi:N-acetyltransferase